MVLAFCDYGEQEAAYSIFLYQKMKVLELKWWEKCPYRRLSLYGTQPEFTQYKELLVELTSTHNRKSYKKYSFQSDLR